jgi:hypothetical protein
MVGFKGGSDYEACDECACAGPVTVTDRFVEGGYPGRGAVRTERVARGFDLVGEAGEDVEAVGTDAVGVFAGTKATAAKFEYLQDTRFALRGAVDV